MSKISKTTARDIEHEMYEIYLQRGAQTRDELLAMGFSQEEIDTYGPRVARRIRLSETA